MSCPLWQLNILLVPLSSKAENITSKKEYAYTTGGLGSVQKTYTYGYRTSGWRDQLLSWNGKSFSYDNAGNPTTYKGESMTWTMGRLLSSYEHSGVTVEYVYSANGERATKSYGISTSNFETTNYYYEGGRLLREERNTQDGTKNIYYLYDETGVIGFVYDGYQYYYRKNAQGDILSVHCGGDLHATYTYDAWGNCTISFDAVGIGALNPFRYRGYYLDRETGLYYLMTRYYDPETGRFVNANSFARLNPRALNGCNLYAYCGENPVMRKVEVNPGRGNLPTPSSASIEQESNSVGQTSASSFITGIHLFGYELRTSGGWESGPYFVSNKFGRIGLSSYETYKSGKEGIFYAFAGLTANQQNLLGVTAYAGVGVNLFGIIGVELQLETVGFAAQISLGTLSISANINIFGETSLNVGVTADLGNGYSTTKGVTFGINSLALGGLIAMIFLPQIAPFLIPAYAFAS